MLRKCCFYRLWAAAQGPTTRQRQSNLTCKLNFTHPRALLRQLCTSRLALAIDISMPTASPSVTMAVPP